MFRLHIWNAMSKGGHEIQPTFFVQATGGLGGGGDFFFPYKTLLISYTPPKKKLETKKLRAIYRVLSTSRRLIYIIKKNVKDLQYTCFLIFWNAQNFD